MGLGSYIRHSLAMGSCIIQRTQPERMQYALQCPPYLGWYLAQVEAPLFLHTVDMKPGDPVSHWSVGTRRILFVRQNCSFRSKLHSFWKNFKSVETDAIAHGLRIKQKLLHGIRDRSS